MNKTTESSKSKYPPCHVAQGDRAKSWTEYRSVGIGCWPEQHTVTHEGKHTFKVCSVWYCMVQDYNNGNTTFCRPEWYERVVEHVKKQ